MMGKRARALWGASAVLVMIAGGVGVAPAFAEDPPPLDWTMVPGFPVVTLDGDFTVSFETGVMATPDFGDVALLNDLPLQRINVVNHTDEVRYIDFGVDVDVEGVIEPLWRGETYGDYWGSTAGAFGVRLEPGQSIADTGAFVYSGFAGLFEGVPRYGGRTVVVYELAEDPAVEPDTAATEIARAPRAPGDFVPVRFDGPTTPEGTVPVGQELSVIGPGAPDEVQLSPGVTASVTASGLPANRELELWLAPGVDYFYMTLLGGILPETAFSVGTTMTDASGDLAATFTVPATAEFGTAYRLFAGTLTENYWPAGTYRAFTITQAVSSASDDVEATETEASLVLSSTTVDFTFPAGTTGMFAAATSTTGPLVDQFSLAGDPPLYYHLDYSGSFDGGAVEVCIQYDTENIPGTPPRLWHHAPEPGAAFRWVDITTSAVPGRVCGVTTSFSPFALGYRDTFDFAGFFDPVSMTEPNVAKAGQSIPVRFSLTGDQGLGVVTSARFVVAGTVLNPAGEMLDAATPGASGLTYDPATDRYTFVWKTQKAWAQKTGAFVLELSDGTTHQFAVSFKR